VDFWIYEKWQRRWEEAKLFEADPDSRPKIFINGAYPYANGRPHLGHFFSTFLRPDIYARYKRMKGFNVLYPQGFHATGQPIAAAARRLREGDPVTRRILIRSGVPEEEIERFKDPEYWIKYFMNWWIRDLRKAGNSIDWRRTFHTTELNPAYDKFIRWQYRKLKEMGLIERGDHPVVWCPKEKIPIGDHDRAEGEGVTPEEMIVIKFEVGGKRLVAATYRPETVYGVVNIWVNPEATYVEAEVDGERWILSKEAADFLSYQRSVKVVREFKGEELLGKRVETLDGRKVPILPATFVDPAFGTGVVMSVPAHAPYDWVAVEEIKGVAEKYGVDPNELTPIPLIEVEGCSEYPAADVVRKYGITSQEQRELLDRATSEIYKKEFYEGRLREIFGDLAGKRVHEAKEEIVRRLRERGIADTIYVLPEPVVCRCGARGVVKLVKNQWFLKYSDPGWKEKAREAAEQTVWTPPEAKAAVLNTIEWLKEWPLTRDVRTSLGTRLPWDESQYIESLSDSTIYMAYYTIAKWLEHPERWGIDIEKLDDSFFDFVFLGKGDPSEVSRKTGIPERMLHEMRQEFLYWYPVDVRFVGKDLLTNHTTFTVFHHAVIFPGLHPRRWSATGHVTMDGKKMSKSKGNFINLGDAVRDYGADPVRFAVALAGNTTLDDANIETRVMEEMREELPRWLDWIKKWYGGGREEENIIDRWFLSEVGKIIDEVDKAYEDLRFRDVALLSWYRMWDVVKKYLRVTKNNPNRGALTTFIEAWIKIIQPLMPHYAEEAWETIGKEPFVSVAPWPEVEWEEKYVKLMEYVDRLVDDIRHVLRLARVEKPERVEIYVAEEWKYPVMKRVGELLPTRDMKRIMEAVPPEYRGEVAPLISRALKDPSKIPEVFATREEEKDFLEATKDYLSELVGVRIEVRDAPGPKPSLPFRPALVVS